MNADSEQEEVLSAFIRVHLRPIKAMSEKTQLRKLTAHVKAAG